MQNSQEENVLCFRVEVLKKFCEGGGRRETGNISAVALSKTKTKNNNKDPTYILCFLQADVCL